jgi:transglutaminase-like putative cysteine protease
MKRLLLLITVFIGFNAIAQDYAGMAKELQSKHKEKEAAVIKSLISYDFVADNVKPQVMVKEIKEESLLSLRYNSKVERTEVYDSNSELLYLIASSNLKQKVTSNDKVCGNYTSDGFFYDDSRFCMINLNLKELGEIWNVTGEMRIRDSRYFTSVYFQEDLPVLKKTLRLKIPANIDVEIKEFNFEGFEITKSSRVENNIRILEFTAQNLPGINRERHDRGIQFSYPHILVLVKSVTIGDKKVNILSSVKDLYGWYGSLVAQLKPQPEIFRKTVDDLLKDKTSDEEKVKAIFYWVQDNIRYIAFENGIAAFKPDEAHNVFEKKYGDCKGMANLTREMLKLAGFDARLTWVGTRKIRYDYTIPSLAVDNHMICTVILNGKKYFLDPTEKYIPLGTYAERIQDRPVLIEDGNNYILDRIPSSGKNLNLESKECRFTLVNDKLEGKFKVNLNGECKKDFLHGYHYSKNEEKEKYIKEYISEENSKINLLKYSDLAERSGPFDIEADMSYDGVSAFSNELYIDIDPGKEFRNWELKEDRQNDVDFGEKIFRKTKIVFEIPSGYKINHIPENLIISDPEFSFTLNYQVQGNTLVYTKEISVEHGLIIKSSFSKWNEAIRRLSKSYSDQVILSK